MTIDTLGLHAAQQLFDATDDLDLDRALQTTERSPTRGRSRSALLVAACLVLVLVAGWLGTRIVLGDEQSAPPLDEAPAPVVGGGLSVPAQLTVPSGWQVARDESVVELRSGDGSDSTMTVVGQPVMVYRPRTSRLVPLREDLVVWATTHPDLVVSDRFGLDGPGFAWTGTEMELAPAEGISEVPLAPLPGPGSVSWMLTVRTTDRTYLFDVIYPPDSPPLVVASRSSAPDDDALKAARNELLESLQLTTPPTE